MNDALPTCPDPREHAQAAQLRRTLGNSRLIGAAVGIIMERELLTYDQAFAVLRLASARLNRRISQLAADTVETGILPSRLTGAGNSSGVSDRVVPPPPGPREEAPSGDAAMCSPPEPARRASGDLARVATRSRDLTVPRATWISLDISGVRRGTCPLATHVLTIDLG